jgi:mediator of replication checkpoint protein 1
MMMSANDYAAENHKKIAFLKAIEDREDDEGMDFFDEPEEVAVSQLDATQDGQVDPAGPSQVAPAPTANMGVKRKLPSEFAVPNMSHRRRPAQDDTFKKPVGPVELRNSISDLLDEPLVPDSQLSDQSDDEEDDSDLGRAIRQHRNDSNSSSVLNPVRPSIINRLTNSRQNSMSTDDDESQAPSGPMAFHTSTSNTNLFKMPSLLRRATTNLSTTSNTSTTISTTTNENAVRMGGSKRSNIHFQAREAERMKKVVDVERRRTERIRKSVAGKGRVSVLGTSLGRKGSGFE